MEMASLLADINVQGQVRVLQKILEGSRWQEVWREVKGSVLIFSDVGLNRDAPDVEVWRLCQAQQLILVTGNRNQDGEDSLESTIQREGTDRSLPVFTLANPEHILRSGEYAERVVIRLLEHLL